MLNNNFEDIVKAQLLMNNREDPIYNFILLSLFTVLLAWAKDLLIFFKNFAINYYNDKFKNVITNTIKIPKYYELFFERDYEKQDNWDKSDAILSKLLKTPSTQSILVIGQLEVIKNNQVVNLTENIKFQLLNLMLKDNQSVVHISFKLFSETLNICDLRHYIDDLVEEYLVNKKNNLGSRIYFFDHIIGSGITAGQTIFTKHPFLSTRTLDNVFHEKQDELKTRVNFFLNNKKWYYEKGYPHTLGLLFTGPPGCGKTSSIKAIANTAKRHIINVNLAHIRTKKQLKKLFYDERIKVCESVDNVMVTTEFIIPIDKRIYVMEDVDANENELVLRRELRKPKDEDDDGGLKFSREPLQEKSDLDLATLLNIFDGTLETPGRILIITTNYPEKMDEALIRPGRIDLNIEYKLCNRKVIKDMVNSFYSIELNDSHFENIIEYKWSPAEVSQILFKHFVSGYEGVIKELEEEKENTALTSISFSDAIPEPEGEAIKENPHPGDKNDIMAAHNARPYIPRDEIKKVVNDDLEIKNLFESPLKESAEPETPLPLSTTHKVNNWILKDKLSGEELIDKLVEDKFRGSFDPNSILYKHYPPDTIQKVNEIYNKQAGNYMLGYNSHQEPFVDPYEQAAQNISNINFNSTANI